MIRMWGGCRGRVFRFSIFDRGFGARYARSGNDKPVFVSGSVNVGEGCKFVQ